MESDFDLSDKKKLQTFKELLDFHNSNSKCFKEEVVRMVFWLQLANDNLKSLVKSWVSTKRKVSENIDQKDDNKDDCRIAIVLENGSIFTEEIELEKIASLKVELSLIASQLLLKVQWLQPVNYVMRHDLDRFSTQKVVATGEVPEGAYVMLWDAGHAYLQFLAATSNVRKTLDIIDNMDFSPAVFHSDLCGPKFIPKLLQFASEVIEKATEYAMHAVADVKFSEE
jgi:hypothetical protein